MPADGKIGSDILGNLLKNNPNSSIQLTGDSVSLPAIAFGDDVSLKIVGADGSYLTLPLKSINLADLAKDLGVDLKDLIIKVTIKKLSGDDSAKVMTGVTSAGSKQKSPSVDFNIGVIGKKSSMG